ncbi:Cation/H(+) antiporter like [Melia azedarach]|uniref:Cation/H(+) antiporter like n=1 Tax=Melia azedarach TaxID=155640 RepID=A0ACC1XK49_MELAZ|nr:Cation/H(+) antiporter like [Melia azedarach]
MAPNFNFKNRTPAQKCKAFVGVTFADGSGKIVGLLLAYILSNLAHQLLKPVHQPRITSDIVIGLMLGNIKPIRNAFELEMIQTLNFIVEFGMICYMFVLGLEMNPYVIFKPPTRDAIVAYAGMLSTFILACSITPFLHFSIHRHIGLTLSLSVSLSGSGSHILTRVITNHKIGKSDIGKLGMAAGIHSDMITMLLLCISFIFFHYDGHSTREHIQSSIKMGSALIIQSLFTAKISPVFMNWINNENPEGKAMKGTHLVLSLAFMVFVCSCATWYGFHPILSAFMAGICFPSEGRMSKWTVGKVNYLLSTVYYPIFFFWMGYHAKLHTFEAGNPGTWARLFSLLVITSIGKVAGTVLCGAMLGFHWPESVALGLLLTAKGHFYIFMATSAAIRQITTSTTSSTMVIVIFLTVVHTPFVVQHIIERARKRAPTRRMALQWLDPSDQLRILLCLHGPHNLTSSTNILEISRGTADPGIVVYVTDMIELTDQIAATLVQNEGVDTVTVTDKTVMEMREEVSNAVQSYVDENGQGITLKRMLALSTFSGMSQDICILAENLMISLIILPFHKRQREDGTLDGGHPGFRYVNRKLLRNATCSVGILVDRGFGLIGRISRSQASLDVAVIFIGGRDDREALAYARQVSRHPGVKLTVIRFLVDSSENPDRPATYKDNTKEQEEEMKIDDECFAEFYERHVAGGHVAYLEKHLANSSETFATLRSLEGQYALIIVGRGMRANSILTVGMNDWQQCPELGPVGDVLSGSDFSVRTSVLIIKQHDFKGDLEGLDEDFSIM